MARLKIAAPDGVREVVLGERLIVGRVEGDLVLDDKGISRKHCEFVKGAAGYTLRDLGSSNGCFVNGEKVTDRALVDGDTVRVGSITMQFLAADADFALKFGAGEHSGREIPLTSARTTLGRRPDNVIPFVDVKVSGVHLEIVKEGDGFVLRDLGSTNGTFLDGNKVTEVALSHGDHVKLGENEFTFVDLRKGDPAPTATGPEKVAVQLPPKKGKAAAVAGLLGVLLVLGGAAAWYFGLFPKSGDGATSGRAAPPAPSGTLLAEDWSFEDSATASGLWSAELGDGFSVRRGGAASGSNAFAATVAGGATTASRREAETIAPSRTLRVTGQLRADERVLASVALKFLRAEGDDAHPRSLTLVAARAHDSGFTAFDVELVPPAWSKRVEVSVVARGDGTAAIDDLAIVAGGAPPGGGAGELALAPRGGGAFAVDHHAPICELGMPFGSGPVASAEESAASTRVELPPGAFDAEIAGNGAQLTLRPGKGDFAAEGFAALCVPELAASGVTLLTTHGSEQRFGAFDVADVNKLLLGSAAERFELSFSKPARVTGATLGDALELRIFTAADLAVAWRTGFENERKEASELLAHAQEDWRAGRAGAALAKLKEIRDRLPHDEKAMSQARQLDAEIVPKLTSELAAIDADAASAEFLGSLERSRRTLTRAQALLAQTEGLDAAKDVGARVERLTQTVAAMEREQREEEAARLLRLARAYEAQRTPAPERKATAAELLAELQKSYADTAAAREARGEAPAPKPEQPEKPEGGTR